MLLTNYAIRNANQARGLGGALCPVRNLDLARMMSFYVGDNDIVNVTDRTSQPAQGLRPPYALVLAPKEGGMSMFDGGIGTLTGAQVAGLFGSATMTGVGDITNAAAGLIVEMVATIASLGQLTASIIGQLEASASLAGSGTLAAAQAALAGMIATLTGTGLLSDAQQQALGNIVATIYVNAGTATTQEIVDGVWNAIVASYAVAGTMGAAVGAAGAGTNPWDVPTTGHTTSGSFGEQVKNKVLTTGKFLALKD